MKNAAIQTRGTIRFDYRRFIKITKEIIDPYQNERFKFKDINME